MQPVYLICGVPGSGKTWVSKQLQDKFEYIPHDLHYKNHSKVVADAASVATRPIITECPFAERELKAYLRAYGVDVRPYFVIESPEVIKHRYETREKKPAPQNNLTRANSIINRAKEWEAPHGTSEEVLKLLKEHEVKPSKLEAPIPKPPSVEPERKIEAVRDVNKW